MAFCGQCGTKSSGAAFCTECGAQVQTAAQIPIETSVSKPAFDELSSDQRQVMQSFVDELSEVVMGYGISALSYEEDDLKEDDLQNNRIWSIVVYDAYGSANLKGVEDDAYRTDAMLSPGFEEGALEYHVSKVEYSEDQPLESNPYTSLFFDCSFCDAEGCEVCDESGFMVYGAVWDDKAVTFSRELP
jgi:hypothetical protein